jgi:hypothetical protein
MVNRHNVFVYDEVEFVTFSKVGGVRGCLMGVQSWPQKNPLSNFF